MMTCQKPSLLPSQCCQNRIVWYRVEFEFIIEIGVAAAFLYVDLQRKLSQFVKSDSRGKLMSGSSAI